MIRRHDDFIRDLGETVNHALDERTSQKQFECLILAHARRLSTGLYHNGQHAVYYTHGRLCSDDFNRPND
jgi:hypothetical protein